MLIQSNFHDYYDSALGTIGVDESVVYRRFGRSIENEIAPEGWFDNGSDYKRFAARHHEPLWYNDPKVQANVFRLEREFLIGFCGQDYYGIEVKSHVEANLHRFLFNDEIGAFIRDYGLDTLGNDYYNPYTAFLQTRERFMLYKARRNAEKVHLKHNVPIFVYVMASNLFLNPRLKDFGFMRVKDPFTAFQEIQSFVGGVLTAPEAPMVTVSEKDKLTQHGFDEKWSFRNPDPPKRKQKRDL